MEDKRVNYDAIQWIKQNTMQRLIMGWHKEGTIHGGEVNICAKVISCEVISLGRYRCSF